MKAAQEKKTEFVEIKTRGCQPQWARWMIRILKKKKGEEARASHRGRV
jgi:hypothetical protein